MFNYLKTKNIYISMKELHIFLNFEIESANIRIFLFSITLYLSK